MATHLCPDTRAAWHGLTAASVLTSLMFLGRLTLGIPLVPELLAQNLLARVPLGFFALAPRLLGAWGKPAGFASFVVLYLLFLTAWGWGTLRWVDTRGPTRPWLGGWLSAALLWAATVGGLFAQLGGPQADGGIFFSAASLFVLHAIYGSILALFCRRLCGVVKETVSVGEGKTAARSLLAALCVLWVHAWLDRL